MKIAEAMQTTRNPHEIAEKTGARISTIRDQLMQTEPLPGWGRVRLQRFIISRRRRFASEWPVTDRALIIENKRLHDQGRVTMCQGHDGDWVIQYAIPTKRPVRRTAYFYGG